MMMMMTLLISLKSSYKVKFYNFYSGVRVLWSLW